MADFFVSAPKLVTNYLLDELGLWLLASKLEILVLNSQYLDFCT